MKFIVSWSLPQATLNAANERFLKAGGLPPAGVKMIGRWHGMSGKGFAVVETTIRRLCTRGARNGPTCCRSRRLRALKTRMPAR